MKFKTLRMQEEIWDYMELHPVFSLQRSVLTTLVPKEHETKMTYSAKLECAILPQYYP